jgi:Lon protease-like protein
MQKIELLEAPLFPLHAVLFPEGELQLRIFESRYLDMISRCLKQDAPFGISLITEGEEVGQAADSHELGTLAHIRDWDQGRDALLSISCSGGRRFRIVDRRVQSNQLTLARVETLAADRLLPVPAEFQELVELLQELQQRDTAPDKPLPEGRFDDAGWVSFRLAERLPLKLAQRQLLLQLDDPVQRLERLTGLLGMQH